MTEAETTQIVTELFERWHRSLLKYALQVPLTYEIAEDLVQETFLQLFQALRSGKHVEHPRAWILCVLRRTISRKLREESRYESMDTVDYIYDPRDSMHDAMSVRDLLGLLSTREKQVLLLRLDGWKYCEIAERLSISMNTVDTLLGRALRKLRVGLSR
jgi:RNA polymerase sigma factor (sigma-70 family)